MGNCLQKYVNITIVGEERSGKTTIFHKIAGTTYRDEITLKLCEIKLKKYNWNLALNDLPGNYGNILLWKHYIGDKNTIIYVMSSEKFDLDDSRTQFYKNLIEVINSRQVRLKNLLLFVNKTDLNDELDLSLIEERFELPRLKKLNIIKQYEIIKITAVENNVNNNIFKGLDWINNNL